MTHLNMLASPSSHVRRTAGEPFWRLNCLRNSLEVNKRQRKSFSQPTPHVGCSWLSLEEKNSQFYLHFIGKNFPDPKDRTACAAYNNRVVDFVAEEMAIIERKLGYVAPCVVCGGQNQDRVISGAFEPQLWAMIYERPICSSACMVQIKREQLVEAKADYKAGIRPDKMINECNKCHKVEVKLYNCAGCRMTHYCGDACQKADWKAHKQVCRAQK